MGRGRAKAKQTKVARDLKYSTPNTDLGRLQQELSTAPKSASVDATSAVEEDDPYAGAFPDDQDEADEPAATR